MKPTISVIMSVYKESVDAITPSINSILDQTNTDWEMVLVLDCPSNSQARTYMHQLAQDYEQIHLIENETNLGLGASLNRAVGYAQGVFCARMDTEDLSMPNRFEKQLAYLKEHEQVDLLFTQWQEQFPDRSIRERRPQAADVRNISRNFFIKSILLHPTLMIKTDILRQYQYPAMARPEDWVLFLDLIRNGYQFDLLEEILYQYQVNPSEKFHKVHVYSQNLLPHLFRNIGYYWANIYFWLYLLRVSLEYLLSRNQLVYEKSIRLVTWIWKKMFRSA